METKLIEIRDEGTLIIALCVNMNPDIIPDPFKLPNLFQWKALRRYGYPCDGRPNIMLTHANGGKKATNDYYDWGDRTYRTAHHYITENWANLKDGDVVDVSFILGETSAPKVSEFA